MTRSIPAPTRLDHGLCDEIVAAIDATCWDAQQHAGAPSGEQWDYDGARFHEATLFATLAINEDAGYFHGDSLANALENMGTIEKRWGAATKTDALCIEIARILNWDTANSDLLAMLRPCSKGIK